MNPIFKEKRLAATKTDKAHAESGNAVCTAAAGTDKPALCVYLTVLSTCTDIPPQERDHYGGSKRNEVCDRAVGSATFDTDEQPATA